MSRAAKTKAASAKAGEARTMLAQAMRFVTMSSFLTFARIAGALAGFVTQIILARTLHASALGIFYSVTSLAAVVGLVAAHGYPAIAPRFLSRYAEQKKTHLIAAFVGRARRDARLYAALATAVTLAGAIAWPQLSDGARWALVAAALSIPANASLRLNGSLAAALRRFALAYVPDTCIRPFVLLLGVLLLLALDVTLTASNVTWLLTLIFTGLALSQFLLLQKDLPRGEAPPPPSRLAKLWRREATPLIIVALFTYFFADVAILLVTPLLSSANTAAIGLCLKLALLVGFAVQVAHSVVVPDLADARARKDPGTISGVALKALGFPFAITAVALAIVVLWGDLILALFGPEFVTAKWPLVILMACQLARALFGPNVPLLTVVGAQWQNAALALAALGVLSAGNLVLVPRYGVEGAAIAVAVATLFWLVATAIVLQRVSGLRTDAVFLLGHVKGIAGKRK